MFFHFWLPGNFPASSSAAAATSSNFSSVPYFFPFKFPSSSLDNSFSFRGDFLFAFVLQIPCLILFLKFQVKLKHASLIHSHHLSHRTKTFIIHWDTTSPRAFKFNKISQWFMYCIIYGLYVCSQSKYSIDYRIEKFQAK